MSGRGRRRIWKFQIPEVSSILGRARPGKAVGEISSNLAIADISKAYESLDTLGSSLLPYVNAGSGPVVFQRKKISILAFEVANTIAKGATLMRSLSEENIQFLKEEILQSDGIQRLVSTDIQELLNIVAADKREEFYVFSKEVARFANYCCDPQWHHLERYFERLWLETMPIVGHQLKEEAETIMQHLVELESITYELYHDLQVLDTLENDYQQKLQEEVSPHTAQRENLLILRRELKHQRKLVKSLKKKSLWSRNLEEVVEKLTDIVSFLCVMVLEAFGRTGINVINCKPDHAPQRLGVLGLAFHYANIIGLIDNMVSGPVSLPPSTRDTLYDALPISVKSALHLQLQSFRAKEGLAVATIESEMQKILQWLFPLADNTIVHQGFGGIGEWANMSTEHDKRPAHQYNVMRIQTLHHADKKKTDAYILQLVVWLHHLASYYGFTTPKSNQYPRRKNTSLSFSTQQHLPLGSHDVKPIDTLLSEVREMLERVSTNRQVLGRSQSYESFCKKGNKARRVVRSCHSSPSREKTGLEFSIG